MPILGIIASSFRSAAGPVGAYDSLATVTLSASTSSITFAGIPTGYKHLEIRMSPQSNRGTYGTDNIALRINGDSGANYAYHYLRGNGASAAAAASTSGTEITEFTTQGCGTSTGGTFGAGVATILDYASTTKYKTVRNLSGVDLNGAVGGGYGYVSLVSGLWMNTAAITSLLFYPVNGTAFTAYSSFALYGVK